jgi:TolB-like protein/DNA-binding winged helix-turn-helix (wHTH) protein/Flp pilus assembly protein TadD
MPVPVPAAAPAACVLRFEIFELDLRAGELRKGGIKLRLQGQPLLVLAALLKRAGNLVTREELRAQIWPADTFVDFDHSLHNAIARLRDVLGDSAELPRYIETLPRRGYRFIAAVEEVGIPAAEPAPARQASSARSPSSKRSKSRLALALSLVSVVAVGLALVLVQTASHGTSATPPVHSIAVLPLDNLSGDPSQEYFADGMTDELITDLAKIGALRVTSRTSVMHYKSTKKSLPEIARELNVDGIIEGSVTRSGKRVRITAQLLYAPLDQHLWAETYERDLGDSLKLQSDVAQAIAQQVRVQLTPQQHTGLSSAHPVNPEAFDEYLKGRYYFLNEFTKTESLNKAKNYFEESIRKDPGFGLAYAGLADSYLYLTVFRRLSPGFAYRSATEALHKALELDDTIGETHDTLGVLSWRYEWNWEAAEREFDRAIQLAPSYSCAHEDRALYLSFVGRRAEALAEVAKSKEIDPSPNSAMTEAGAYYQLRDYASLVDTARRSVASNPNEWTGYYNLGIGYEGSGKILEAISEYQKAIELSNGDQDVTAALAHAYAVIGKEAQAKKILRELEEKTVYISPYALATIYAGLGDKETAFKFLERAYRERSLDVTWHIKADPRIDNLRTDPRFRSLLHRIGLPA